jgi:hypothetical protein
MGTPIWSSPNSPSRRIPDLDLLHRREGREFELAEQKLPAHLSSE